MSGKGVGASVGAKQYGKDLIHLNSIIDELYTDIEPKPILLAPGGFYDKSWFEQLLKVSGPRVVNALTHHIYNLGPGWYFLSLISLQISWFLCIYIIARSKIS